MTRSGAAMTRSGASMKRLGGDDGMSIVELVILFPILVMMMQLVIIGGRIAVISNDVQSAAREAARTASLANSRPSAANLIDPVVETSLSQRNIECDGGPHTVMTGAFHPGNDITVRVRCWVRVDDVNWFPLIPMPRVRVSGSATEPIDTYRVVGP